MFDINDLHNRLEIIMSATLANIDQADDIVADFSRTHNWPVDLFALRILLREAVLNAVTHGCHENPLQQVTIQIGLENGDVDLTVTDSGPGFNWRDHADYSQELAEGGRGMALMKIYSSCMDYNDPGNQVRIKLCGKVQPVNNRQF
jgi:serine/threonine-protein kinase RsbW